MSDIKKLIERVETTHAKYLEEKAAWKKEKEELLQANEELTKKLSDNEEVEQLKKENKEILDKYEELVDKYENLVSEAKINKDSYESIISNLKSQNESYVKSLEENKNGWTVREVELNKKIDSLTSELNDLKAKAGKSIKHLVEDIIEPMEKQRVEDVKLTIKENGGPAKQVVKRIIVQSAEKDLQDIIGQKS